MSPPINSATFIFSGVFFYQEKMLNEKLLTHYEYHPHFLDARHYYEQKYYPNWLKAVFADAGPASKQLSQNHFRSKHLSPLQRLQIGGRAGIIDYEIFSVEAILFRERMGIFILKARLAPSSLYLEAASDFAATFRQTTYNEAIAETPPAIELIEQHIIRHFTSELGEWRSYNPQLKATILVDMDAPLSPEQRDELLFELGTFQLIGVVRGESFFTPAAAYYERILQEHSIEVFNNWKALCLFDSMVRISVQLDEEDPFRVWENEYHLVYIYVLLIRFYLYWTNSRLADLTVNVGESARIRNEFIEFLNDYDLSRISYKFLPNLIYRQFRASLDIDEEIEKLEDKVSKISELVQERQDRNIERLLLALTVLSSFTIINDMVSFILLWIGLEEDHPLYSSRFRFMTLIMAGLLVIIGIVWWLRIRRKSR